MNLAYRTMSPLLMPARFRLPELHAQPALSNQLSTGSRVQRLLSNGVSPPHFPHNAGKFFYEKARRMCQLEDARERNQRQYPRTVNASTWVSHPPGLIPH